MISSLYLIGSMRNPAIAETANALEKALGIEVYCSWACAGPTADEYWKAFEIERGHNYAEAMEGHHARDIFETDKRHLDRCDAAVLLLPAGRSGHLELGYTIGRGKPGYILLDDPDRWDIMYRYATGLFYQVEGVIEAVRQA